MKESYMKSEILLQIAFEDTHGCHAIFNKTRYTCNCIKYNILKPLYDKSNPGIFHINKNVLSDVDYYIIVFDLDPPRGNTLYKKDVIFKYETILNTFEDYYKKGIGINITNPTKEDYVGNKITLIPNFFCSETLYLFLSELNNLFIQIQYDEYKPFDILHTHHLTMAECPLAYYKIRSENPRNKYFQNLIQKYYYSLSKELLIEYFKCKDIDLNDNENEDNKRLNRAINKKRTDEVMNKLCKISGNNIYEQLRTNMGYYASFNKALFDLFSIRTDNDIDSLIKKYNFHTYQHTIENLLSIYEGMICWDPSKDKDFLEQTWYKQYITYLNQEFASEQIQYFTLALNNLCRYYTK